MNFPLLPVVWKKNTLLRALFLLLVVGVSILTGYFTNYRAHFIHVHSFVSVVFLFIFIIVLSAMAIIFIFRRQSSKYYRTLYEQQHISQNVLRDSEHFVRTIINSAQEGIIVFDRFQRYVIWNSFMERITGMDERSLIGKCALDIFPHLRRQGVDKLFQRALSGETVPTPDMSYTIPSNGKNGWVESTYAPHRSADGTIIGVVAIVKDITERKQAEDILAEQREQLAVTLRSIGDGVISTDKNGCVVLMNRVAESLTGWKLSEALGKPLSEIFQIIDEISRTPRENPVEKVLRTSGIITLANHTLLKSRDGMERIIADSGAPIKDKKSQTIGVVLVFRDNTENQKAQENMIKAEKLESIGVLAGGIAHDFNNLLGGIFGYMELARELARGNEKVVTALSKAIKTFNRARDLTKQLLTFAKGGSPSKKTMSLGCLITDMAQFALSGSNVRCVFSIQSDLWPCDVDEHQIGQVIDNIVINAKQAMTQGGEIEIKAENIVVDDNRVLQLGKGHYVKISIKDHGPGIPREIMTKIFDPFFTTKPKGTGLGLATCFSIIQKHEGFIDVETELGKGSLFNIYLPASQMPANEFPLSIGQPIKGAGRILVLDDEEFMREVVTDMLVRLGYEVAQAGSGEEAIAMVKDSIVDQHPFHAAILDLTIPGAMGGKEAVKAIYSIDANIKAIASSGYFDDPVMAQPGSFGFTAKIKKPYLIDELGEVLSLVFNKNG